MVGYAAPNSQLSKSTDCDWYYFSHLSLTWNSNRRPGDNFGEGERRSQLFVHYFHRTYQLLDRTFFLRAHAQMLQRSAVFCRSSIAMTIDQGEHERQQPSHLATLTTYARARASSSLLFSSFRMENETGVRTPRPADRTPIKRVRASSEVEIAASFAASRGECVREGKRANALLL